MSLVLSSDIVCDTSDITETVLNVHGKNKQSPIIIQRLLHGPIGLVHPDYHKMWKLVKKKRYTVQCSDSVLHFDFAADKFLADVPQLFSNLVIHGGIMPWLVFAVPVHLAGDAL